jgi:hypothetical protein
MFVPSLVGAYLLWRRSRVGALLVMYLAVTMLFYSVVPGIITPRNRVQVLFIWAWVQFHPFYHLLLAYAARRGELRAIPHQSAAVSASSPVSV